MRHYFRDGGSPWMETDEYRLAELMEMGFEVISVDDSKAMTVDDRQTRRLLLDAMREIKRRRGSVRLVRRIREYLGE